MIETNTTIDGNDKYYKICCRNNDVNITMPTIRFDNQNITISRVDKTEGFICKLIAAEGNFFCGDESFIILPGCCGIILCSNLEMNSWYVQVGRID
jgi:hypothetical protein